MDNYLWTRHSEWKMKQYALSKQRVKRVVRNPDRIEKSIVPKMVAVMQVAGTSKHRYEIWVMYELKLKSKNEKVKIADQKEKKIPSLEQLSPAARFREMRRREFTQKQGNMGNEKSLRIISTWKYPGESPKRDPIPQEILEEIQEIQ
jgi:hypothetical protein